MLRIGLWLGVALALAVPSVTPSMAEAQYEDDFGTEEAPPEGEGLPAQEGPAGYEEAPPPEEAPPAAGEPGLLGDEQALTEERVGVETARDSTDPYEDPEEGYFFAGLFYRHLFVPEFFLNLFTDESSGASNPALGAEVTYRKDNFSIVGSLWWAGYGVEGAFRGSGDPEFDVEWIDSNLSMVILSASFLWSTQFNDIVALEYGIDVGLGVVLGDLQRTEARPAGDGFEPCPVYDPSNPYCGGGPEVGGFCDDQEGEHYCEEGKWTDGGSVPNIFPWLAIPHLALRIKPIRQLQIRIDTGLGLAQIFLGGSVSYGF